jgi:hypothetical protein
VRVVGGAAVEVVGEPSPVDAVATDHAVSLRVHCHICASHLLKIDNISIKNDVKLSILTVTKNVI